MSDTSLIFSILGEDKASGAIRDVGGSLDDTAEKARKFRDAAGDSAGGLDRFGEAADTTDTRAMGFRDTLTGVQDTMGGVSAIAKGDLFNGFFTLGAGIGDLGSGLYNFLVPAMQSFMSSALGAKVQAIALATWSGIVRAATLVWAGVQWVLNAALSANPIGLVIIAIAALVAGIVWAWKNSETFRNIVTKAWQWIWDKVKAVGNWFKNTLWPWIKGVWDNIGRANEVLKNALSRAWQWIWDKIKAPAVWMVTTLWPWIKGVWDKISLGTSVLKDKIVGVWNSVLGFFKGIPKKLGAIGSRMWDGFKTGFRAILNWIIGKWNSISFGIPRIDLGPLGSFGGQTFRVPQIPYLAKGGNIIGSGMAIVGERGPELLNLPRGAQVSPLARGRGGGGGTEHLIIEFRGLPEEMKKTMRRVTRKDGRGSAQIAFGS